jgi:16S rRNA (cytosine967-C5)-methyltransferase
VSAAGARSRVTAARALRDVLDDGRSLTDALAGLDAALPDARDRALVRRLCHRVLRDRPALEWRADQLLRKPLARRARIVHYLLLAGIDQLVEGREPARAVVHASVEAVRAAGHAPLGKLVNAVLRSYQRRADELEGRLPDEPALRSGYPEWLLARIRADWPSDWQAIVRAGNAVPPVWLRANRRRTSPEALCERLAAADVPCELDAVAPDGVRLRQQVRIGALPGFDAGDCSVQDAGAQHAADLLDLADGQRVLDACAAPGGKAAHALERADIDLVAVDADSARAERVTAALRRLGLAARVEIADATAPGDWAGDARWDRILIDAPCSGTGVLRRHPDIRWLRRPADIDANVRVQRALLAALWPRLRPGGLLVYATCSILHAENREVVRDFVANHADAEVAPPALPGSVAVDPGEQILPGSLDRDGFYYAVLRRLRR